MLRDEKAEEWLKIFFCFWSHDSPGVLVRINVAEKEEGLDGLHKNEAPVAVVDDELKEVFQSLLFFATLLDTLKPLVKYCEEF